MAGNQSAPRSVPFGEAFRFWLKLGFINFGGPAGQIAILHRETVERRRWLSENRFLHALNFCMLLPGPEAQQLATYIGWLLHGTRGAIVAGTFFILPSVFVLLGLSYLYAAHGKLPLVVGILDGFKPVAVAIVAEAVLRMGRRTLHNAAHGAIAAVAFVAIYVLRAPFPLIVIGAAITGWLLRRSLSATVALPLVPGARAAETNHTVGEQSPLLDDASPPHRHSLDSGRRSWRILAVGLAMWVLPLAALVAWRGWNSLHVTEYRFFSQAALVTFGGAYAVLAYVTQAATESFGWITRAQAVDGLALAETTPGPLIMVLQFVGFLAAWNQPDGLSPLTSAVTGALITTYVTFLPSFLFILLGAPFVEVLRGNRHLNGALSGVTSAVVGVILNLALVFGAASFWPGGLAGGMNLFALLVALAAFLVLCRTRAGVAWVVAAGGLAGLLRAWIQ